MFVMSDVTQVGTNLSESDKIAKDKIDCFAVNWNSDLQKNRRYTTTISSLNLKNWNPNFIICNLKSKIHKKNLLIADNVLPQF